MAFSQERRTRANCFSRARTHVCMPRAVLIIALLHAAHVYAAQAQEQVSVASAGRLAVTNLASHIAALADNRFVSVEGKAMRRADVAKMAIVRAGAEALPQLNDALRDQAPLVRARVLPIVAILGTQKGAPPDVLPTLSGALSDPEILVRQAAVGALGELCRSLDGEPQHQVLDVASSYLARALLDKAQEVRVPAAIVLIKCGKQELVPRALRKEVEMLSGIGLQQSPDGSHSNPPASTKREQ